MDRPATRRDFLNTLCGTLAAGALAGSWPRGAGAEESARPRLKKAVKFGMIQAGKSIEDKFALIKSLGFEGVEMDSPSNVSIQEAISARDKTGIVIHGVVDSVHWDLRLSDPDPAVRAKGLAALRGALRDAKAYGATTVLLVPGKVTHPQTENYNQVDSRSQAEIRKALPEAEALGVKIAIEVVGNHFITTPTQFINYVDVFDSPNVGAYFDVSNVVASNTPPADWIRVLGKRMLKFDFKGLSKLKGPVAIGEGDENWPDVRKALAEVGYHGWATAEVDGGDEAYLRDISKRMDQCLGTG